MEELRDLQQIYSAAAIRFNEYDGKDFILPQAFKDQVKEINSSKITYNDYSAVIETKGTQNGVLNIYLPNQWFYIASYFTDLYNELLRYKKEALKVVSKERLKELNGGTLTNEEMSHIDNLPLNDSSKSFLMRFITDYSWWNGAKTIDRGDFYVSPILNSARLVNASQSSVADLCAFLSDKQHLVDMIVAGVENEDGSGVSEDEMDFRSRQVIYYGAPGTGKSNTIKREVDDKNKINFRVTFHPDSDYSTFVGCYKPTTVKTGERAAQPILDYDSLVDKFKEYLTVPNVNITKACTLFGFDYHDSIIRIQENGHKVMDLVNDAYKSNTSYDSVVRGGMACYEQNPNLGGGSKITYEFVPQAFTKAYTAAWNTDENVYLVIEEINRGNCAQIFGDLFQLLDRKKGISEYPVDADSDLAEHIRKELRNSTREDIPDSVREGKKLVLPSNLYIYATMNTSDQSLFPIDSAFKRRWDWMYVPIADAQKGWKIDVEGKMYDWWDFLSKINDLVGTATSSEDKKLGYFFCKANGNVISAETFVSKVVFYLWNDVFKDFPQEAGKGFTDSDGSVLSFNKFYYVDRGGITRVRKDKVRMMLDNLGVSSGDSTVDTEKMEADAATSSKNTLKEIVFPDGTVIDASNGTFDAYIKAIEKMGVDKVCSVADELKYRRRGRPLISKEQYPEMISEYGYSYVTLGEYNFLKGTKTYTYVRILEDLAEKLGITITIHN